MPINQYVSIRESIKEEMTEPSWLGDFKVSDITSMMGIKEDNMVDYGSMFVLKDYRGN